MHNLKNAQNKILVVIPVRAGSKGIPHKNVKPFNGKSLLAYTITTAQLSSYTPEILVTTDDPVAQDIAREAGVEVVSRPAELAGDTVTLDAVVFHALKAFEVKHGMPKLCITMQVTSPLLTSGTLDNAIAEFLSDTKHDAMISVVKDVALTWHREGAEFAPSYKKRLNRQYLPVSYRETGAFVISRVEAVSDNARWRNNNVTVYEIPQNEAIDIDTESDWIAAEAQIAKRSQALFSNALPQCPTLWEEKVRNGQVYLIAEIGVNYYDIAKERNISTLDAAKLMIKEAAAAGCDAVKFQTYKAETLASKYSPSYWDTNEEPTQSQYELFKKFDHFGEREYRELSAYAKDCTGGGVDFLSTPFDLESADYLNPLMDIYKISSSDLNNLPFVEYMALKQKPIFLSVGAANVDEIDRTLQCIRRVNNAPIALLHCVLEYPTPLQDANLEKIRSLRMRYPNLYIGYSDHTKPTEECDVIKLAVALGVQIIEKHFTLNKTLVGNDHYHAMDPNDVRRIVASVRRARTLLGSGALRCLETEMVARKNARRSLVATCDIPKETILTREMLTFKRPGHGIPPSRLQSIIGKRTLCDISEDTILQDGMLL